MPLVRALRLWAQFWHGVPRERHRHLEGSAGFALIREGRHDGGRACFTSKKEIMADNARDANAFRLDREEEGCLFVDVMASSSTYSYPTRLPAASPATGTPSSRCRPHREGQDRREEAEAVLRGSPPSQHEQGMAGFGFRTRVLILPGPPTSGWSLWTTRNILKRPTRRFKL